ncbi:MAG: hypothetical protein EBX41_01980 [Chitinophagia bacterium]|nr:hypothetical protein [Chitinophagia bacterium]
MGMEVTAIAQAVGAIMNSASAVIKSQMAKLDRFAAIDNATIAYDSQIDKDLNAAALAAQAQADRIVMIAVAGILLLIIVLAFLKRS